MFIFELCLNLSKLITDYRKPRNQIYSFEFLFISALFAVASGKFNCVGISNFVDSRLSLFQKYFNIDKAPSHDTYRRFLNSISCEEFLRVMEILVLLLQALKPTHFAIDGKTIRNSHTAIQRALHIISLFDVDNRLTISHVTVPEKSNEITAVPELLKEQDLQGVCVTGDALLTQKNICKIIVEGGGYYIFCAKGNQQKLKAGSQNVLSNPKLYKDIATIRTRSKGTTIIRTAVVSHIVPEELKELWPGLVCVGEIEKEIREGKKTTTEKRYFISSKRLSAKELLEKVQKHWEIENQLHRVLDKDLLEDKTCIKNPIGAENMNILKKIVINFYHAIKKQNNCTISYIQEHISGNFLYFSREIEKILSNVKDNEVYKQLMGTC